MMVTTASIDIFRFPALTVFEKKLAKSAELLHAGVACSIAGVYFGARLQSPLRPAVGGLLYLGVFSLAGLPGSGCIFRCSASRASAA